MEKSTNLCVKVEEESNITTKVKNAQSTGTRRLTEKLITRWPEK